MGSESSFATSVGTPSNARTVDRPGRVTGRPPASATFPERRQSTRDRSHALGRLLVVVCLSARLLRTSRPGWRSWEAAALQVTHESTAQARLPQNSVDV
jgi:hypothetical protein